MIRVLGLASVQFLEPMIRVPGVLCMVPKALNMGSRALGMVPRALSRGS